MWEGTACLSGPLGCKFLRNLYFECSKGHVLYLPNSPSSGDRFLFPPLRTPAPLPQLHVILDPGRGWWEPTSARETTVPRPWACFIHVRGNIGILSDDAFSNSEKQGWFLLQTVGWRSWLLLEVMFLARGRYQCTEWTVVFKKKKKKNNAVLVAVRSLVQSEAQVSPVPALPWLGCGAALPGWHDLFLQLRKHFLLLFNVLQWQTVLVRNPALACNQESWLIQLPC